MSQTHFVLVAVTGVEDFRAAEAAVENLTNDEQRFEVEQTMTNDEDDDVLEFSSPTIYFP